MMVYVFDKHELFWGIKQKKLPKNNSGSRVIAEDAHRR